MDFMDKLAMSNHSRCFRYHFSEKNVEVRVSVPESGSPGVLIGHEQNYGYKNQI
jgi:hypothetical protein